MKLDEKARNSSTVSSRVRRDDDDEIDTSTPPAAPGTYHYDPDRLFLAKYRYRWDAFKWDGPIRSLAISCLMECLANFFITLPAVLTIAECLLSGQNQDVLTTQQVMSVAMAYGVGVTIAVICFVPVAGGQIHSSVSVILALIGLVDVWKVPFLILGCFLAELYAAAIYWNAVLPIRNAVLTRGQVSSKTLGFSSLFSLSKRQNRALPHIFLADLVTSFITGTVLCSCFDSSNAFVSVSTVGPLLGAYFGLHVLAFLPASALGHSGHDLGSRLACWTLLGRQGSCFDSAGTVNAVLTPILGMLLGVLFFIFFMADSRRPPARMQIARSEDRIRKENRRSMCVSALRDLELEEAELQRRVDLRNIDLAPPHPHSRHNSFRSRNTPESDTDISTRAILRHGPKESIQEKIRRSLQLSRGAGHLQKPYLRESKMGGPKKAIRRRSSYLDVFNRSPARSDGIALQRSESYHGSTSTEQHRPHLKVDLPDDWEGNLREVLHRASTIDDVENIQLPRSAPLQHRRLY